MFQGLFPPSFMRPYYLLPLGKVYRPHGSISSRYIKMPTLQSSFSMLPIQVLTYFLKASQFLPNIYLPLSLKLTNFVIIIPYNFFFAFLHIPYGSAVDKHIYYMFL